jgi:high affinity sulfate transporter 1
MTAQAGGQGFLARHVPMTGWIRGYKWGTWLRPDAIAGISVAALLIPESLGYAGVAGLPPEVGLYAAPLALLGYAILGRSTILVVATSSSTAAVSASVIATINQGGDSESAIALSAALALFTGLILVVAGLLRLGWVANFMSKTVIEGFIIGLSINIIIGQLDEILGIDVTGESAVAELVDALSQFGSWDQSSMIVGFASLALLFGLERFAPKVPAALTVVVLSVLYVQIVDPDIAVVGEIPQGLPEVGIPDFSSDDVVDLLLGGLAVALIGFSEGYGAASSFARKYGDRLQNNQEFIAVGASNIGASLTSGMVVGGSLSKSAANDSAGAKSQISNVVVAALVVLTLLFLAPFFESLPEATLAAVVIHALWHSANPRKLAPVWRVSRVEFWLAVVVLIAVLTLDTLPAILIGVIVSLAVLVYRISFPQVSEMGRDPHTGVFESLAVHEDAERIPAIVVYRFDAPIIYSNAGAFTDGARRLVDAADPPARVLILDCEEMFEIDFTGIEAVDGLVEEMRDAGVKVRLARVHGPMMDKLRSSGVIERLGEENVFRQVGEAARAGS